MITLSTSPGRKKYVDSSTQVDMDMEDILNSPPPPLAATSQRYMCFAKQMFLTSQKHAAIMDQAREALVAQASKDHEALRQATGAETPLTPVHEGQPIHNDVEMQDAVEETSTAAELPSNPPVQKPRPPDDQDEPMEDPANNHDPVFKPPPSPQSLHGRFSSDRKPPINGYRSADLHVQLPPKQQFSNDPSTPTVGTPNASLSLLAQSPTLMTPTPGLYPSLSNSSSSALIQPSPAKKKISFGEFIRRNSHKPDTPAVEKGDQQLQSCSPTTSTTLDQNIKPPLETLREEAKDQDHPMNGSAIFDIPSKPELKLDAATADGDNPAPP